jgi:integrase
VALLDFGRVVHVPARDAMYPRRRRTTMAISLSTPTFKPFPPLKFHGPTKQHYYWNSTKKDRDYLGRDYARARETYDRRKREYEERCRAAAAPPPVRDQADATVSQVLLRYFRFRRSEGIGRKDLDHVRRACKLARRFYGDEPARVFRAKSLRALRERLLQMTASPPGRKRKPEDEPKKKRRHITPRHEGPRPLSRRYVNRLVSVVRSAWAWAATEDLVPADVAMSLRLLPGLRKGRGGRELPRVTDVDPAHVAATLPELNLHVRAMVELQQLAGMRPGELCHFRRRDLSVSKAERVPLPETSKKLTAIDAEGTLVWVAIPESHKTLWRGRKPRVVVLGPKAQAILRPFLEGRGPDDFLFSPREASDAWRAANDRRAVYGQGREPGEHYTTASYGRSIGYAVERINRRRREADPAAELLPHWRPYQLRHSAATEIAEEFDRSTASAVLGNSMDVIDLYCEQEVRKAARAAAAMG